MLNVLLFGLAVVLPHRFLALAWKCRGGRGCTWGALPRVLRGHRLTLVAAKVVTPRVARGRGGGSAATSRAAI